ncbi:MAG TPA: response regulator [Terriglobales bacterium]|nr:response regulator [Terriglobales bacterium]
MVRKALVVDDSMLIRHTVCRFLESRGFEVQSASNGLEALEVLASLQPDIIITDMQMPRMSGGELITALKAKPETAVIPIVVLAGRQSGFDHNETRANFAIFKDIDIDAQLHHAITSALGDLPPKP